MAGLGVLELDGEETGTFGPCLSRFRRDTTCALPKSYNRLYVELGVEDTDLLDEDEDLLSRSFAAWTLARPSLYNLSHTGLDDIALLRFADEAEAFLLRFCS